MKSSSTKIGLRSGTDWNAEWTKWFTRYSLGTPRLGMWLDSNYTLEEYDILELGAGSCRESRYLCKSARTVSCVDFSEIAMEALKADSPPANLSAFTMDAFKLGFQNKSFDFTFHKGFWSLFEDDADVEKLFREQLRVTKKTLLALVHNQRNTTMMADFTGRSEADKLYQVRFFDPSWLLSMANRELEKASIHGSVRVKKFGGANWAFHRSIPIAFRPFQSALASALYKRLPWSRVESIVLEVELTARS